MNPAIDRASRFLNLASLASVLLAAVAVAMGARRYAARHIDAVALMKCMGASQRFVLAISIIELTLLALVGGGRGRALRLCRAMGTRVAAAGSDPRTSCRPPRSRRLPIALVTVMAMLIGFALPPLLQLKNTPPARVLRQDRDGAAAAFRPGRTRSPSVRCSRFCGAWCATRELVVSVLAGVLGVGWCWPPAGYGLVRITGRLRGGVGVAWRYGLANVSRRGGGSVVQIVAFGLGLMVLLLLAVVRGDLLADWRRSLPSDVPNNFLVNISPDERAPLEEFLRAHGFGRAGDVSDGARAHDRHRRGARRVAASSRVSARAGFVEREQNLTWSAPYAEDNQLIAGRWWTAAESGQAAGVDLLRVSGSAAA